MKNQIALLCSLIAIVYAVFLVKYNAREKIRELTKLEKLITNEKRDIQLLKIDLEHLSQPSAIRKLLYLTPNLKPITPFQVIEIK